MFGSEYSRLKFWVVSLITLIIGAPLITIGRAIENSGNELPLAVISLVVGSILINTLANRIRAYGSNPWLSLLAILPLVGMIMAIYYGIAFQKKQS